MDGLALTLAFEAISKKVWFLSLLGRQKSCFMFAEGFSGVDLQLP